MNTIMDVMQDKNDMMLNIESIKGEPYAKFVDLVCLCLSGFHGAMSITEHNNPKVMEMMDMLLSATMTGICTRWADHLDLSEEQVKEAMEDAHRLVTHVDSQLEHVKGNRND